jgi:formylglycine-generating enzyme required for sulfatase activity
MARREPWLVLAAALVLGSTDPGALAGSDLDFIDLPGGEVMMGDPDGEPDEVRRKVGIEPFALMRYEVTNQAFAAFVRDTGHVTDAEQNGQGYVWTGSWRLLDGADWRRPFGPLTSAGGVDDHPVVQVSAADAAAFCAFHGGRLKIKTEWEYAAGGGEGRRCPGGERAPDRRGRLGRAWWGAGVCWGAGGGAGSW